MARLRKKPCRLNGADAGGTIEKRTGCTFGGVCRVASHAAPLPTANDAIEIAAAIKPVRARERAGAATIAEAAGGALRASFNRNRTTEMSGIRALRSLVRHFLMIAVTYAGTSRGIVLQSGSPLRTVASTSETSSPSNARRPGSEASPQTDE